MDEIEFQRITNRAGGARALSADERRNAEVVLATYAAFAGHWDAAEQAAFYTPDFVDHSTMHGATFADLAAFVAAFRAAFPHGSVTIERLLVDGDFVVAQVIGRLSDEHLPDAAIEIYRLENGRIAEHWDVIRPNADLGAATARVEAHPIRGART